MTGVDDFPGREEARMRWDAFMRLLTSESPDARWRRWLEQWQPAEGDLVQ